MNVVNEGKSVEIEGGEKAVPGHDLLIEFINLVNQHARAREAREEELREFSVNTEATANPLAQPVKDKQDANSPTPEDQHNISIGGDHSAITKKKFKPQSVRPSLQPQQRQQLVSDLIKNQTSVQESKVERFIPKQHSKKDSNCDETPPKGGQANKPSENYHTQSSFKDQAVKRKMARTAQSESDGAHEILKF